MKITEQKGKGETANMKMAQALNILERTRDRSIGDGNVNGIAYEEAEEVSAREIVEARNITPFSFDFPNRRMIFVETPPEVRLSDAAFVYQAQNEHATRLYSMEYETLNRIAEDLPDPQSLIFLHSTGRCGSTLLSKAFNEVKGVVGLSEPDIFTQVCHRERFEESDAYTEVLPVLKSCIRVFCRLSDRTWVIKPRSMVAEIADLLHETMPFAKNIYLYRGAFGYIRSWARIHGRSLDEWSADAGMLRHTSWFIPLVKNHFSNPEEVTGARYYTYFWLATILRYLEFYPRGLWTCALRYEELTADPHGILTELFSACGLPVSEVDAALKAFEQDSQAGTHLSRENTRRDGEDFVLPKHEAEIEAILREFPQVGTPDVILPGTIGTRSK